MSKKKKKKLYIFVTQYLWHCYQIRTKYKSRNAFCFLFWIIYDKTLVHKTSLTPSKHVNIKSRFEKIPEILLESSQHGPWFTEMYRVNIYFKFISFTFACVCVCDVLGKRTIIPSGITEIHLLAN